MPLRVNLSVAMIKYKDLHWISAGPRIYLHVDAVTTR
jgi:hypothetical protein